MADTILAADDDRGVLLLIESILETAGHRLVTVGDGEEARDLVEKDPGRFSAILLDWDMPKRTGIDLLRWIKGQPELEQVPVIMQTAMDSTEEIREGIEAGAFYYLTKPFDRRLLLSIVNAALSDFHYKISLAKKLLESQNPFRILVAGKFRYRTLEEGERLAVWIANASPSPENAAAISEIMTNAVEHGNLAISYEEKTGLIETGRWYAEVERRLALPEFSDRYVEVMIENALSGLTVLVEDQGAGFDYRKFLDFDEARVFDNHGRGIAVAALSMSLEYLGRGNKVRVMIPAA